MGLDDVRLAHVSHTEHQAWNSIPVADNSIAREEQRLGTFLGTRQLGKHNAHHERLDEDTRNALDAHREYRLRALLRHIAITIAYRRLGFHGVQEGGHHIGDLCYADRVRHVGHQIG